LPHSKVANQESDAHRALARFLLQSTPNGRFLHYCWSRSRKRAFLIRQSLSVLACGTLALLYDPVFGLLNLAVVMFADVLDCLWMRNVWSKWRRSLVPQKIQTITLAMAVLQSAAVGLTTIISWQAVSTGVATEDLQLEFFGVAYLVGVGLNIGLVRPYVPRIAGAKMSMIFGAFIAIFIMVIGTAESVQGWVMANAYLLAAILIQILVARSFLEMVGSHYTRNLVAKEALLRNQVALSEAGMEVAHREQQARRLALIAESTNEAIFVTDVQGKISWTNAAFTTITGYDQDEVLGRDPAEFMNAPDTDPEAVARILESQRSGKKARVEILNRRKDGAEQWISTSITPVYEADGTLMMCIQVERDVTQERLRTEQLAEMNEQAKAAAKAKERFFATMSHEIRTPMNGVLGMADLLSRTELNPEQQSYLSAIRQSGDALLSIINDILDLSKLQSGKVRVEVSAFDLADVVSSVVTLLWPLAKDKGIQLRVTAGTERPVWVMGDAGRTRQVLMNLVGNAIKFTSEGEVTVQMERGADDAFRIHVADTGIGINHDRLEAIFDSFTQADGAIDRQYGGTGLGLTISRMLARAMGGDVTAVSQKDRGSTFTLSLPLRAAEPERPVISLVQDVGVQHGSARQKRILVAEDNGTNRLILRKMLEPTAALLTEVTNGAEAVAAYHQEAPDLIIMDMQMPVMDGLTAIREIRQKEREAGLPRCPILILSANVFRDEVDAGFAADCDDYLTKPVHREALLASMARLLDSGVAEQALPRARGLA
jgi:two-component system, sensor histidine kinase